MKTSTLILTLNEERSLPACLGSLDWCDDIVVLDSGSADRTVELARQAGARVLQRPFDDFARQRNHGLEQGDLRHDWVLHLDADERVPPELRDEIAGLADAGPEQAFEVPSKLMFMGTWLRHAGMYPTYQARLGRRDVLRFKQVGHGQREDLPREHVGRLRCALLHDAFSKGIDDWIARHVRYAAQEAAQAAAGGDADWAGLVARGDPVRRRRALKALSYRLPCRPTARFLYMYLLRLGMLDGRAGLAYCRLMALYEAIVAVKLEAARHGDA